MTDEHKNGYTQKQKPFIFTASALADFHACPELFRRRWLVPRMEGAPIDWPIHAGKAFHAALRAWFAGSAFLHEGDTGGERLDMAIGELRAAWLAPATPEEAVFEIGDTQYRLPHLEALLREYARAWPRESDGFAVVLNEHRAIGEIGGLPYVGHIDRAIMFPDNSLYVMDTKTAARALTNEFFAAFELSFQLIGYVMLLGADGAYVDAVHIDTRRHTVKRAHLERRGPLRFPPWRREMLRVALDDGYARLHTYRQRFGDVAEWPRQTGSCFRYTKVCEMWDVCVGAPL